MDRLDKAFFELADARRAPRRYIIKLDRLTSKITDEEMRQNVAEKLQAENASLDEYIKQILDKWVTDNGQEEPVVVGEVDYNVQLKKEPKEIDNPDEGPIPYLISNILDKSQLCSLFLNPNYLQDEAAKFARIGFLLEQMSAQCSSWPVNRSRPDAVKTWAMLHGTRTTESKYSSHLGCKT